MTESDVVVFLGGRGGGFFIGLGVTWISISPSGLDEPPDPDASGAAYGLPGLIRSGGESDTSRAGLERGSGTDDDDDARVSRSIELGCFSTPRDRFPRTELGDRTGD